MATTNLTLPHSPAWVVQCWVNFIVATSATGIGLWQLNADGWVKGFLALGVLFSLGSAVSLSKTVRDMHEASRLTARIDEARFQRLVAEHDPLKPAA